MCKSTIITSKQTTASPREGDARGPLRPVASGMKDWGRRRAACHPSHHTSSQPVPRPGRPGTNSSLYTCGQEFGESLYTKGMHRFKKCQAQERDILAPMRGCDGTFCFLNYPVFSFAMCEGGVPAPLHKTQTMPPEQRGGHAMAIRVIGTNFIKTTSNKIHSEASLTHVPTAMDDTGAAATRSRLLLLLKLATRWQYCHVENEGGTYRNVVKVKKVALCLSELLSSSSDCWTPSLFESTFRRRQTHCRGSKHSDQNQAKSRYRPNCGC